MDEQPHPKSIADMTPGERAALLRRHETPADDDAMEIGGTSPAKVARRIGGRLLIAVGIVAAFVLGFFQFTGSWRVAMIVVGLMAAYMLAIGKLTEGRPDRLD